MKAKKTRKLWLGAEFYTSPWDAACDSLMEAHLNNRCQIDLDLAKTHSGRTTYIPWYTSVEDWRRMFPEEAYHERAPDLGKSRAKKLGAKTVNIRPSDPRGFP